MKELLEKIDIKVDKLDDHLDRVDKTLVRQEANLAEHMRRTELLESQHDLLVKELLPVKTHVEQVKISMKLLAFLIPLITSAIFAYFKLS